MATATFSEKELEDIKGDFGERVLSPKKTQRFITVKRQ